LLLISIQIGSAWPAIYPAQTAIAADDTEQAFDYDIALKISQEAIDNQVANHLFTNTDGKRLTLNDLRGKPLVLSMIYTSCYQICPMTTRYLAKVVDKARNALGEDSFSVAIVGFDTNFDTPETMQYFANKQGISDKGWHLLSIAKEDVDALLKDIGFVYYPSSNGFDHIIQATVIDADGKVYRQVYGQAFETPLLVDPLIELGLGRPQPSESLISGLTSKIKLFCTTYDPVRDGYYLDYSLFLGMLIGAFIIVVTGIFIMREIRNKQGWIRRIGRRE
jgi:protein SCO1/2